MAIDREKVENTASVTSKGLGWTGWLTVIFVVLKLNPGGHLDSQVENWSWWLVFIFPLIGLGIFALFVVGFAIFGLVALYRAFFGDMKRKRLIKRVNAMTPEERREFYANNRKRR